MFPLQDNIPSRTTPFCNYALVAICSLIFLAQTREGENDVSLVERYGMIPARVLRPEEPVVIPIRQDIVLTPNGPERVITTREAAPSAVPPWMTLATCIFLHGSWMHLLGNMWFLLIFGDNVEDRLGHVGYLVFYVLGGAIASGIHLLTNLSPPNSAMPTVGASGAIAAVMGAYFVWYPHAKVRTFIPVFIIPFFVVVPATLFLGLWFLMQLLQGTTSHLQSEAGGVAWWAHIGGFGAGYLIAGALGHSPLCRPRNTLTRAYNPQPPVIRFRPRD